MRVLISCFFLILQIHIFSIDLAIADSIQKYRTKEITRPATFDEDCLLFSFFGHPDAPICLDKDRQTAKSLDERVLELLIDGTLELKKENIDEPRAYSLYLEALEIAETLDSKILICESLKKLLTYLLYKKQDQNTFNSFLERHQNYSYDILEKAYNKYFELRGALEYFQESEDVDIEESVWSDLIDQCRQGNFIKLLTEVYSIYGVYLDVFESDYDSAISMYENAMKNAKLVNEEYYQDVRFTSLANIGFIHKSKSEPKKAISAFKEAMNNRNMQIEKSNDIMLNKWISETYESTRQHDSAYHYLDKSYRISNEYNNLQQTTKVTEINEKYENQKLLTELAEGEIELRNNQIIALILGFLSLSFMAFYLLHRRISQLKLSETIRASELKAINARIDGEENERKRVASVLHDSVASQLTAASFQLGAITGQGLESTITKTRDLIQKTSIQTRDLSHTLFPPSLEKLGLVEAIRSLAESYSSEGLQFIISSSWKTRYLSDTEETTIYFVVQEIFQNAIKHSGASICHVTFETIKTSLHIIVKDNGKGFDVKSLDSNQTLGIQSIRGRIKSLNGSFSIINNQYHKETIQEIIIPQLATPHK